MAEVAWKFREFSSSKHTKCCLDKYNLSVSAIFKRVIQLRTSYKNMKDNYEPSGYAPGYFQIKWHTQGLGFIKLQCFKNKMCSNHISKICKVTAGLTKWNSATAPCEKNPHVFKLRCLAHLKKLDRRYIKIDENLLQYWLLLSLYLRYEFPCQ